MSTTFKYHPLNETRPDIRLLEIMPAPDRSLPLECTIRHGTLSSSRYSCLSYVWGQKRNDATSRIAITYKKPILERLKLSRRRQSPDSENSQMEIGSNLAAALVHLRGKEKRVTIWADALCINQQDNEERNWQVKLMTRIYSKATHVHAWLGPRFDDDPNVISAICHAFNMVPTIEGLLKRSNVAKIFLDEISWSTACSKLANMDPHNAIQREGSRTPWVAVSNQVRGALVSKGSWDPFLSAFHQLSQVKYFQRMWILQETGRAQTLTFHYGEQKAPYKLLFFCLCLARPFCRSRRSNSLSSTFDSRFLSCLAARIHCNLKSDLAKVLELAYWQRPPMLDASDHRDLIYALLGLASDDGIEPHYEFGVEYAFISATQLLLTEDFTNILLSFKPYMSSEVDISDEDFPSWAYDWSTRGITTSFDKSRACGDTKPAISFVKFPYHGGGSKEMMAIRGRKCGSVTMTGNLFSAVHSAVGFGEHIVQNYHNPEPSTKPPATNEIRTSSASFFDQLGLQYQHLGIGETLKATGRFFNESGLSIGGFGLWWMKWILELWDLVVMHLHDQPKDPEGVLNSIRELLWSNADSPQLNSQSPHDLISPPFLLSIFPSQSQEQPASNTFQTAFRSAYGMRPLVLSGRGGPGNRYLGYGPEEAQTGDEIVVFEGVNAPLVLRKARFGQRQAVYGRDFDMHYDSQGYYYYKIVGPAHVCGVMEGQLFNDTNQIQSATKRFWIG